MTIGLLLNITLAGVSLIRSKQSQRREVSFADTYASREEMSEIKTEVRNLRMEFKGDVRGVHCRIDEVLAAVSRLEGEIKHI